jgi:hypothetical protein
MTTPRDEQPGWLLTANTNVQEAFDAMDALPLEQAVEYTRRMSDWFRARYGARMARQVNNHQTEHHQREDAP